jgi:hypothetical protein
VNNRVRQIMQRNRRVRFGAIRADVAAAPLYPTVANSLLWADFLTQGCSDTAGATPCNDGDAIWTVRLFSGWGASLGDGLIRQDTGANRPTFRAGIGAQPNGTSSIMSLPASITLSGAFTVWHVLNFNGSNARNLFALGGTSGTADGSIAEAWQAGETRTYDDVVGYLQTLAHSNTGIAVIRVRRDTGNNMFFRVTGVGETAKGSTSFSWVLNRVIGRNTFAASSTARAIAAIAVGADAVTAGTSAAVEAAILSKYGVSL